MTPTRVAVLTPPGSGAIAVLSIGGPDAWTIVRSNFRTARGDCLPDRALFPAMWFGRFGRDVADEVIVVARGPERVEIHCHGGRRVVQWLLDLLGAADVREQAWSEEWDGRYANQVAAALLPFARTVRTAGILLDQATGAYDRAVDTVSRGELDGHVVSDQLRRNASVGRHLVEPWTVAIAGLPNAGKSTLLNALAGFSRSIVSPIPGTTRDTVSVSVAFDGWPVDLIDTAGLRESSDQVEGEGIARARQAVLGSNLCLWLVEATGSLPGSITEIAAELGREPANTLVVLNKCDLAEVSARVLPDVPRISAATGAGLTELAARIALMLVPYPPRPGDPVPFTPDLCDLWS